MLRPAHARLVRPEFAPVSQATPTEKARILVIEAYPHLGVPIATHLSEAGYRPTWLRDADRLPGTLDGFDLIILDLLLPGAYGLDVLRRLRPDSEIPVFIVSAKSDTAEKVRAFALGADDYLSKPYSPEELVARARARLRRPRRVREDGITVGELHIDPTERRVTLGGEEIACTRVEFEILLALGRRPGTAISRTRLVERVLDQDRHGDERTLDVHLSRLRKKIGKGWIETVWGVGYRLAP